MSYCLRKQESSLLVGLKSPSPGFGFASAGLSRQGRAECFIRLKCYEKTVLLPVDRFLGRF